MVRTFDDLIRSAEKDPKFWVQVTLQEFVHSLQSLMDTRDITTRARLAELVGVKPSTVSRWLNGNENVTVESMCRLAFAIGGAVHIHVADKNDKGRWKIEPSISTMDALQAKKREEAWTVVKTEDHESDHIGASREAMREARTMELLEIRLPPEGMRHIPATSMAGDFLHQPQSFTGALNA